MSPSGCRWGEGEESKTSEEKKNSNSLKGELKLGGAGSRIQFGDGGMFTVGVKPRGWSHVHSQILSTPTSSIIFMILPPGEPTGLLIMSHKHTHSTYAYTHTIILNNPWWVMSPTQTQLFTWSDLNKNGQAIGFFYWSVQLTLCGNLTTYGSIRYGFLT